MRWRTARGRLFAAFKKRFWDIYHNAISLIWQNLNKL